MVQWIVVLLEQIFLDLKRCEATSEAVALRVAGGRLTVSDFMSDGSYIIAPHEGCVTIAYRI